MAAPERLGDFRIVEEIGRGGFGIVYRARQVSLDRPVAVKVLYRHLVHTEDQRARFEREARAAARLDHPSIVSVYAWGQSDDDVYIAQRLVGNGRTLADELAELRRAGTPPKGHFRQVAERLAAVAEGLQQAHERGIVHRDVKPSNILLDEAGRPCLGDFGLAKVEDGLELSRTGDFAGSPYFMSPEQADSRRGPVDHRTDVYSLGVTLYELLTLTPPFQGQNAHEIIRRILTEEPRQPTRIESRVPHDLETICLKAMEKEPGRRYQSSQAFSDDLQAFLDGEPISAVPIGTTRRVVRQMRRHREAVVFAVLGTIVAVGGLWGGKFLIQSRDERAKSEAAAQLQTQHVQDLGQAQDQFSENIQKAAAAQDTEAVASLVAEQQRFTQVINENYKWLSEQLGTMGDGDALRQVAAGVATGGLYGGLESLQQVAVGKKAANERDALVKDLNDRLGQVLRVLSKDGARAPRGVRAASEAAAAALPFAGRIVLLEGRPFLVIGGQCLPLPTEAATSGSEASAGAGREAFESGAAGEVGGPSLPAASAPGVGGVQGAADPGPGAPR